MNHLYNLISRYFTKDLEGTNKTVYDLFNWKTVKVEILDYKTNKLIFSRDNLEFPDFYSQNACNIIASKYFRQSGVPNGNGYERSMKEITHRLVNFWTTYALEQGLITKDNSQIFYDELAYGILSQRWAPNSPQWFNTGLKLSYGIDKDSEGHFYYDEKLDKVMPSTDAFTRTQGSACFINGIDDTLLGPRSITDLITTETRLFKQGSGTGTNFSNIRAIDEPLSGGGKSSGLMSFLKVLDRNAGAIKSGGTTRRAAKMVCLDYDHPEIMEFITWKAREEQKVRDLGKMGYDISFEGEAYETVSGQNANNSVRFSDKFMRKVISKNDDTIYLKGRKSESVNKEISVNELWNTFNESSWNCADPAPQFDDIINAWHTCPAGEDGLYGAKHNRINASNPCSEYHFLDDTACNLASINIRKFYDEHTKTFDLEGLTHLTALIQIVLDTTIYQGQFPTAEIARKSFMFRTTGLGIANTGSTLMAMAIPYDSEEGRNVSAAIMGIVTGYSYYVSSLMAEKAGAFPKFKINKEYMLRVIRNHSRAAGAMLDDFEGLDYSPIKVDHDLLDKLSLKDLSETLKSSWELAYSHGKEVGYRNAQVTVIAPTGTIALAMDCDTTSIEPFFSHIVWKNLSGGGYMKLVNTTIRTALETLGYNKEEMDSIISYIDGNGRIEDAPFLKEAHYPIFDTANKSHGGYRFISPLGHVKMVAALTPFVSGAISKTVNLPNDATVEDFKAVHEESWKLGVKCIALYRDGSKVSQPLNVSLDSGEKKLESMTYQELIDYAKSLENKLKNIPEEAAISEEVIPEGHHKVKCGNCGSEQIVPNGTCSLCLTCGSTSGCS
ncbi:vitamin B12-dependent ribonucleotide reductase [Clostridium paridis]|uniref:Vitamin B12-dependent ribonucleotide reductase n=1 Tax=Clostridium paridis TaxID=2803863 RepID=A0A937K6E7_9CLOT|nr:vitamin B12-dependent ribonucleotide reductase [Clostridium paridis]MBL4933733.1 vitamin B12-dependent ribonucleotide reductase [Clostridium paridis]